MNERMNESVSSLGTLPVFWGAVPAAAATEWTPEINDVTFYTKKY